MADTNVQAKTNAITVIVQDGTGRVARGPTQVAVETTAPSTAIKLPGSSEAVVSLEQTVAKVEAPGPVGRPGPQGIQGPAGPIGPTGPAGGEYFLFNQAVASNVWVIQHNLNSYPVIQVVDSAGNQQIGDISFDTLNQVTLTFTNAFAGVAYLVI